jgi:2-C-methyl-D-erythritol 4-phosphate cytidylyltransferase
VSRGETWAIVVAGGSGARLGADRPKAFVRFGERTMLAASLATLEEHDGVDGMVVVVPEGWEERTSLLVEDLCASKVAVAIAGGETRPDSVAAGLAELPDSCALVLVHDAARPLVAAALVDRVLEALDGGAEAVVPALDIVDTVKRVDGDGTVVETLVRTELRAVQTPQGFRRDLLERAYAGDRSGATDCASLVERAGARVQVVAGDPRNLKVTTMDDLQRAETLFKDG